MRRFSRVRRAAALQDTLRVLVDLRRERVLLGDGSVLGLGPREQPLLDGAVPWPALGDEAFGARVDRRSVDALDDVPCRRDDALGAEEPRLASRSSSERPPAARSAIRRDASETSDRSAAAARLGLVVRDLGRELLRVAHSGLRVQPLLHGGRVAAVERLGDPRRRLRHLGARVAAELVLGRLRTLKLPAGRLLALRVQPRAHLAGALARELRRHLVDLGRALRLRLRLREPRARARALRAASSFSARWRADSYSRAPTARARAPASAR